MHRNLLCANKLLRAPDGNRTRISSLGSSYLNHWTTSAMFLEANIPQSDGNDKRGFALLQTTAGFGMMEHMSGTLSSRWAGFEPMAKALYVSSFPKVERFPYGLICAVAYLPGFHFRTWYIDGKFIGLTYTLTRHSMSVIYYLAVVEEERGKGYGALILKELCKLRPRTALITESDDIQAANRVQRQRRIAFYLRNGFVQTGWQLADYSGLYDIMATVSGLDVRKARRLIGRFTPWVQSRLVRSPGVPSPGA